MSDTSNELKRTLKDSLGFEGTAWSLGRLFSPPGSGRVPLWGLFVFDTSGNLHFVNFNQNNWYSALVQNSSGTAVKSDKDVHIHLVFEKSAILSLIEIQKKGFFKFMKKSFPLFHLKIMDSDETVIFELENPGNEIRELFGQFTS